MSRLAPWPLLALLAACDLCKPTPPPPGPCTSDASCPAGDACLAGSCQSLTQVLQNLTAVVTPLSGNLAPQQIQSIDGTQASVPLTLEAPQLWNFNIPIPPTCTAAEALPITLRFTGQSVVPLLDWTFTFTTDAEGNVQGALPTNQQEFAEWITTATPCAAPISLTYPSLPGPAPIPTFDTGGVLTVVGAISAPGAAVTFAGASVTIKGAQVPYLGQALSATVTSLSSPTAGAPGFVLPVPLGAVEASASACAPPPIGATCGGGPCPALDGCAVLTLEIGPSALQPNLPTFDLPIVGRYASTTVGASAGPILSLMGEDGLGVQLPLGPGQLVNVSGTIKEPKNPQPVPLDSADVTIACVQADGGNLCPQGFAYRLSTLSGANGAAPGTFTLQAPPGLTNEYTLTVTPPPGLGLAPFSEAVTVPASALDAGVTGLEVTVPEGDQLSGTILDPTGTTPITAGQVLATSLVTGAVVGVTSLQSDGTFELTLPPGPYMVVVQPDSSTGLPDWSRPESLLGDQDLGPQSLYAAARLGGGVFATSLDGGPSFPVAQASLQFFYITATQAYGTVALPIASGITDSQGHFSVAVPSSTATAN